MIKLVFALRRRPELSQAEFQAYWREHHAPLVKKHAAKLGVRRYVQSHTMAESLNASFRDTRQGPEPYDGVAELWWDSLEELERYIQSPEARQAGMELLADERNFIDLASSPLWLVEEHTIVDS